MKNFYNFSLAMDAEDIASHSLLHMMITSLVRRQCLNINGELENWRNKKVMARP
jgi:hypothetical protein